MTPLAPHITAFFQQRLPIERGASGHTSDSYAYAFKLLLEYSSKRLHRQPSALFLEQIDARLVTDFLNHLEVTRANRASSRNVRLAAIKSFMHFMEFREPAAIDQIRRILAIPMKKTESRLVRHLTVEEMHAILNAPEPSTWESIRDRAMLHLCFAAGLRVSELVGLQLDQVNLQPQANIIVHGKGRRERCLPLWKVTTSALRAWLGVRGKAPTPEVFLNSQRRPLTRSGFEYILTKHVKTAAVSCPSLAARRVSPHVLRHTCALTVLQATKDLRKVSLWLGHANMETTEMYTRADPSVKLEALEAMIAPNLRSGRFKATDKLIATLTARSVMRRPTPPD